MRSLARNVPSLVDLPQQALFRIGSFLLDERDIAALRCTCQDLRGLYTIHLWQTLLRVRFGERAEESEQEQEFRRLATLRQPACSISEIIWLDGHHLEVTQHPSHVAGSHSRDGCIMVLSVCWLQLSATFPGVLPGDYFSCWRIKLMPGWEVDWLDVQAQLGDNRDGGAQGLAQTRIVRWQLQQMAHEVRLACQIKDPLTMWLTHSCVCRRMGAGLSCRCRSQCLPWARLSRSSPARTEIGNGGWFSTRFGCDVRALEANTHTRHKTGSVHCHAT